MRCVLDSNIGVKWLLQEDQSDKARIIRDEAASSFWSEVHWRFWR